MSHHWLAIGFCGIFGLTGTALSQQNGPTPQDTPTLASSSGYPLWPSSSYAAGSSNDNGSNGNNDDEGSGGINTYYAVGLGLLFISIGVLLYFVFQRKAREIASRRRNGGRENALRRDIGPDYPAGDPAAGQGYMPSIRGWRRGAERVNEEGLNERGEAPPQYISKQEWDQLHGNSAGEQQPPAVPLQTLDRDRAGLKPPDYVGSGTDETAPNAESSVPATGVSATAQHRTNA